MIRAKPATTFVVYATLIEKNRDKTTFINGLVYETHI